MVFGRYSHNKPNGFSQRWKTIVSVQHTINKIKAMWIRRNWILQGSEKHRKLRNIFRGHYNFVFDSEMGEAAGYLECLAICLPAYLPTSYLPTYLPTYLLPAYLPTSYLPTYLHSFLLTYLSAYLPTPTFLLPTCTYPATYSFTRTTRQQHFAIFLPFSLIAHWTICQPTELPYIPTCFCLPTHLPIPFTYQ